MSTFRSEQLRQPLSLSGAIITGSLLISGSGLTITGSIFASSLVTSSTSITNVVMQGANGQLFVTSSSAIGGGGSGVIGTLGSTLYSINPSVGSNFSTTNSILLGFSAGNNSPRAEYSNFIGFQAGQNATDALYSNFIGTVAGTGANNANLSNFFGSNAGATATDAMVSNFIGWYAGFGAVSASYSNFIGQQAGENAKRANYSNIIGFCSGLLAVSASYSTLIGYNIGRYSSEASGALGIKSNNIIIGTNITLPNGAQDSINIGGILFGTGSYSTTSGLPFSGSAGGRVGINVVSPDYTLDISGSTRISDVLILPFQNPLPSNKPTGSIALSGSGGTLNGMYVYNGTSWVNIKT